VAVVSDTSPISYLVLIGEIDALHVLYGEVLVPPAVAGELSHPDGPGPTRQWIEAPPEWLRVEGVPGEVAREGGPGPESTLWSLDPGEREAIRLAERTGAKALLIDERDGRQVAKQRGVPVTGTLGVLDEAASEGLVDAQHVADRLRETSFRAPEELYQWLLSRHE
jgi:predicted nucleic acid-binding protein